MLKCQGHLPGLIVSSYVFNGSASAHDIAQCMQHFGRILLQGQYWISKPVHSPACTCVGCLQISCSLQSGQPLSQKLSLSPCLNICSSYLARTETADHQQTLSACKSAAAVRVCRLTLCHMCNAGIYAPSAISTTTSTD